MGVCGCGQWQPVYFSVVELSSNNYYYIALELYCTVAMPVDGSGMGCPFGGSDSAVCLVTVVCVPSWWQ